MTSSNGRTAILYVWGIDISCHARKSKPRTYVFSGMSNKSMISNLPCHNFGRLTHWKLDPKLFRVCHSGKLLLSVFYSFFFLQTMGFLSQWLDKCNSSEWATSNCCLWFLTLLLLVLLLMALKICWFWSNLWIWKSFSLFAFFFALILALHFCAYLCAPFLCSTVLILALLFCAQFLCSSFALFFYALLRAHLKTLCSLDCSLFP